MTHNNYNTEKRNFKHLNYEQRKIIEKLLGQKIPKIQIAKLLGIARSTLYEEIERGSVTQLNSNLIQYTKYFAETGQRVYENNRKNSRKPLKMNEVIDFILYAEEKILKEKLSPDVICGRAKITNQFKKIVCTKTLYNYIDKGILKVKNIDLPLRVKLKSKSRKTRKNRRILGESIEKRGAEINERKDFGHWEIDTVIGTKTKGAVLLTLDERLTRKRIIKKIEDRTENAVTKGLLEIYNSFGENAASIFKSITSDNGSEFAKLAETLPNVEIYYTHPYTSCERGTNEKQNSLIRYFYPKGKSFENVSKSSISLVENWINDLPRKFANYSTPTELFQIELEKLGIVL